MVTEINTPTTLSMKLVQYEDPETAVAVYKEATGLRAAYQDVMDAARAFIANHIETMGERKGRTSVGTFGVSNPNAKFELDKVVWDLMIATDPALAEAQQSFNTAEQAYRQAQKRLKTLQEPFESVDVTPEGTVYIR